MSDPQVSQDTNTVANSAVLTKYQTAGSIAERVLGEILRLAVPGATVGELCQKGDELLEEETAKVYNNKKVSKGVAFPTCVSPNDCVAHLSPLPSDEEYKWALKEGDVAKVIVGAHIDGYATIVSGTVAIGTISEEVEAAINAAYIATEAALRKFKPGNRNWDVTRVVDQATSEFGVSALEGMMSCEHNQNQVAGKKRLILNPSQEQRRDFETVTFGENEVYGLDVLVGAQGSRGKTKQKLTQTTVYRKTDLTYQLKLRTSRQAISEVQKKCGQFPFNVKLLEDQKRVRMALQEPLNHGLLDAYDVVYEKDSKPVVQMFTTFAITKTGVVKLASAPAPKVSPVVQDEELKQLLSTSLKSNKKKKKTEKKIDAESGLKE